MTGETGRALFADLVFNEEGEPARVVHIGAVAHYAVPDGDFMRHVEARYVDHQIVALIKERILPMKDAIIESAVQMLGQEDLFTRPALEDAIENMDRILDSRVADADQLRTALWMTGFRVTVDVHGDVVHLDIPGAEGEAYE